MKWFWQSFIVALPELPVWRYKVSDPSSVVPETYRSSLSRHQQVG
jgi:hypothetical protein